eukprot:TRINITY_DN2343_c1_g1_i1.p1 TRINITY_DN2343_c1_g1~~TRINITY_DN2343_c1_g1_i1.p1  ORF type:complete len:501 (+),score=147.99 TRINITY_DN2343_c1_g1_i1:40-1542(+)
MRLSCLKSFGRVAGRRSVYTAAPSEQPAVIIGVRQGDKDESFSLTSSGEKLNELVGGEIASRLSQSGKALKEGSSRLVGVVHPDHGPVIAVGLGKHKELNPEEGIDTNREAVRMAAAAGVKTLAELGLPSGKMETFEDAEAAGEGAALSNWTFQTFKADKKPKPAIFSLDESSDWERGLKLGNAQNLARELMEYPANHLTPILFANKVCEELQGLPIDIKVRDEKWAEEMKMGSFMSVARGSYEPLRFLEMTYSGGEKDAAPIVFVGKGVTFDTGGISIKPSAKMDKMRADMGGAATVTASLKAAAELGLPVNLVVLIPLTENMPGGKATKPGDVVTAMNGKTIQIDNTDAEGRLILADALSYADSFNPRLVLDVATLTGAISVALGTGATGVFASSSKDFDVLAAAGVHSGDRVWRMPLWDHYAKLMKKSPLADLNNISLTPGGGSCTAAAFLRQFTNSKNWLHLDIAGVMENEGAVPYLGSGMSGRPTRTMVKFLQHI